MTVPGVDPVHKVSIIPRGIGSLGYTIQRPIEDRFLMTRDELEAKLTVLLGGRAAERLVFDELSTGAADDLAKATEIARSMVMRYGMDEHLGNATYDTDRTTFLGTPAPVEPRRLSEDTNRAIDQAIREILDSAFERAMTLLRLHREVLEAGAQKLLEQETLEEPDLRAIEASLGNARAVPAETGA